MHDILISERKSPSTPAWKNKLLASLWQSVWRVFCWSWTSTIVCQCLRACFVFWPTDCWCDLNETFEDLHFHSIWRKIKNSQFTSRHGQESCQVRVFRKLMLSACSESQTCFGWKSPFLSQLGMGIVKRSSWVRLLDANLSSALCSSARHGAYRRNKFYIRPIRNTLISVVKFFYTLNTEMLTIMYKILMPKKFKSWVKL